MRQVIGFLDPTVLYPFQNFKRPWPRENNHHPDDHIMSLDWAVAERRSVAHHFTDFPADHQIGAACLGLYRRVASIAVL